MFLGLIALFLSGKLKFDFFIIFSLGCFLTYWIVSNQPLPLFPSIHEDSSEMEVFARFIVLECYLFAIVCLVIGQFF